MMTLFVEELTVLDFSYLDSGRGILGQSWMVDVHLSGQLNELGFIQDFTLVKKNLKQDLDAAADHKFLVPAGHSGFHNIEGVKDQVNFHFEGEKGKFSYRAPLESTVLLPTAVVNQGSVKTLLMEAIKKNLPDNVTSIGISLREETGDGTFFQYTHGLKKHDGNCQRMVHGHRSTLRLFRNGIRDKDLEKEWAGKWDGAYLATDSDLADSDPKSLTFGYRGTQGEFELKIPKGQCVLIRDDTTVECLARHLRLELEKKYPTDAFVVRLYEGVGKGAVSTTPPSG